MIPNTAFKTKTKTKYKNNNNNKTATNNSFFTHFFREDLQRKPLFFLFLFFLFFLEASIKGSLTKGVLISPITFNRVDLCLPFVSNPGRVLDIDPCRRNGDVCVYVRDGRFLITRNPLVIINKVSCRIFLGCPAGCRVVQGFSVYKDVGCTKV